MRTIFYTSRSRICVSSRVTLADSRHLSTWSRLAPPPHQPWPSSLLRRRPSNHVSVTGRRPGTDETASTFSAANDRRHLSPAEPAHAADAGDF